MTRVEEDTGSLEYLKPRLLSQNSKTQVILCDTFEGDIRNINPCVLKLFHPSVKALYANELAVYELRSSIPDLVDIVPERLWSGRWSAGRYREFIGNGFPNLLRKSDKHILVLAIEYIEDVGPLHVLPEDLRSYIVKAALHSLRALHTAGILHGDVSNQNMLVTKTDERYEIEWIDFGASSTAASPDLIALEWENAINYFSDLVQ
jgi:serine/threonine protein kinase